MYLGYNTNGLAHHDLLQALELLHEIGYAGVALTIDHGALNPFGPELTSQLNQVRAAIQRYEMRSVVETGARFLLDWRRKHEPTLLSPLPSDRARRKEFLCHAIKIAAELNSDCVSFWSGVLRESISPDIAMRRLVDALRPVLDFADQLGVVMAFEPEPGMFIDTMSSYQELVDRIDAPHFQLTLDVGHLHCLGETPIAGVIDQWSSRITNIHIEDMRRGVHEHLMFGEGEMEFAPILAALAGIRYQDGIHVELSRHSHEGPDAARKSFEFLRSILEQQSGM